MSFDITYLFNPNPRARGAQTAPEGAEEEEMSRFLGVMCAFLAFVSTVMALANMSWSWSWGLLVLWTIGLWILAGTGWKEIEIGWRGQLLFLGERVKNTDELKEGWRWVPWPFGLKVADCRQITLSLGELVATTADDVPVFIDSTVMYKVVVLDKYFDVEEKGLQTALDHSRTQVLRAEVRQLDLEKVLNLHEQLAEQVKDALEHEDWGIDVVEVIIPEIKPEPKVAEDLALQEREKLQKRGQVVEANLFNELVEKFKAAGRTDEQAYEQAQLTIGKATKDIKAIKLDAQTIETIVTAVLGRK